MFFDNQLFFLLFVVSFICCLHIDLIHGHSHDGDDSHDDEHDSHTCHFGVTPYFGFPLAEDECGFLSNSDGAYSFKFECHDEDEGEAYKYNNTNCSGDAIETVTITDRTMFDCESESECDVLLVDREYYEDATTSCSGTLTEEDYFAFSTGIECVSLVNYTKEYFSIEYDESNQVLSMLWYFNDSSCMEADLVINYTAGCQDDPFEVNDGKTMIVFEIEDDNANTIEDDNANTIQSTIYIWVSSVMLLLSFY